MFLNQEQRHNFRSFCHLMGLTEDEAIDLIFKTMKVLIKLHQRAMKDFKKVLVKLLLFTLGCLSVSALIGLILAIMRGKEIDIYIWNLMDKIF